MSKKDKSKFKKRLKAQILEKLAQEKDIPEIKAPKVSSNQPAQSIKTDIPTAAAQFSDINISQIKYDLKKTAVLIAVIVVIILAIYLLDLKYNILISLGNWLFEVLHIQ